jgi:hypothetical protein
MPGSNPVPGLWFFSAHTTHTLCLACDFKHCPALFSPFLQLMHGLEAGLPAHKRTVPTTASTTSTVEQSYECGHPYANSMDETTSVCIPGAQSITIVFDPRTRTEAGCDWLR